MVKHWMEIYFATLVGNWTLGEDTNASLNFIKLTKFEFPRILVLTCINNTFIIEEWHVESSI